MVTNRDECVTVKSPSKNILVENIYCNWSGGCAFGSLGADTAISTVHYKNIYTWNSNQMMMIKSNGGSGYVEDILFENFIGHGNAYSLNVEQYWSSMKMIDGNGVKLTNLTFKVPTNYSKMLVKAQKSNIYCRTGKAQQPTAPNEVQSA